MKAQEVLSGFRKQFGPKIKKPVIQHVGVNDSKKHVTERIWFQIDRKHLHDAVRYLCDKYPYPHFAVCSGYDTGTELEMMYHFTINYGVRAGEIMLTMHVMLPKKDPVIGTITDLIPGALISEREMQEMLGIKVKGIPDSRRVFLDESFPHGVFPWRRDETGPHKLIRNAHER
ncbi:MAG: NADH-quinone oxidoreductase subunit C [Candidatus Aenigmatarchaeota archaeon]|nr:MAG: NADH-quinone oxidoreductase subunit C [Candidatus Aenigmarchaeota archaeon]